MNYRSLIALICVLLAAAGCATDKRSGAFDPTFDAADNPDVDEEPDVEEPDVDEEIEEEEIDEPDVDVRRSCVLFPSVSGDIFVAAGGTIEVGAYVYDFDTQDPMSDIDVSFSVVDQPGDGGGFTVRQVGSDAEGLAETSFLGGLTPGVVTVEIDADCGEAKTFEIEVLELPKGNLRVLFEYPQRTIYGISPVEVELFQGDRVQCDDLNPGDDPDGQMRSGSASTVGGNVRFDELSIDSPYTVVVQGIGARGERAAWGCADDIVLVEDVTTDALVRIDLLPLNFEGRYRVDSNWNFQEALQGSGPAGQVINQIANVFIDPGNAIYDVLLDVLGLVFGDLVSGGIDLILDLFGLDGTIQGLINDLIGDVRDSVPFLDTIFRVGETLANVVNNLDLTQIWDVQQYGGSGTTSSVIVDVSFVAMNVYWLAGGGNPDCDINRPEECPAISIPLDRSGGGIGTLDTQFEGTITSYNSLSIFTHTYDFNYLALIQVVLEEFVFPSLLDREGPIFLDDLAYELIGCPGIGNAIGGGNNDCLISDGFIGDLVGCVCDEQSTCNTENCSRCLAIEEDVCEAGIGLVLGPVLGGIFDAFALESVLTVNGGDATLFNIDDDLTVDLITDGEYRSSLNFGEGNRPDVPGQFDGERIGD